jgi:uncharacterized protein (TIGR03435 family)
MTMWTTTAGWTLLHFVWEGALVALIAALALRLLRGASAQARYVTACAGLLAALLAPIATAPTVAMLSSVRVPSVAVSNGALPGGGRLVEAIREGGRSARVNLTRLAPQPAASVDGPDVLAWLVGLWVVGVLALTTRLGVGWWLVRRLHHIALVEAPSEWIDAASRLAARLGLSRTIHVVDSHLVDTPTVIGWLRPVIVLPVAALANLSPGQVQAILAHELAHIRRHDFLVNLLQTLAETVLFYHPAIWWLSNRIRAEREHCCDDIAVEVCGDPVAYVEALTELASWAATASPLALAATGGSLLTRVRRLLQRPATADRRRPKAPMVIAAAVLLVVLAGVRWIVVAQGLDGLPPLPADRSVGPLEINRLVGFDLFPGPAHYPTDDPPQARAWDVTVAYPGGGEMTFRGFTARSLVRYAFDLPGDMPVLDGPAWLDTQSQAVRAQTGALDPQDLQFREAIRGVLETQFGLSIRRDVRNLPVLALMLKTPNQLGPNIHPATVECLDGRRGRPFEAPPSLIARGQQATLCGIDDGITGPHGYKVTMAEFARSLRRFPMHAANHGDDREVIDQTGLDGEYDFRLHLGFLPFAAVATMHPDMAAAMGPLGISTLHGAIDEQLGMRLVPMDAPREVMVIASARRAS